MVTLFNAGPRSLSAPSAHPPQSRAGSPTRLADRKALVVLATHVSGPKTAHTHPASRREWSEATHTLTLREKSNSEKQGMVWRTPLSIPCVVSLAAASAAQTAGRLSRGR